MSTRKHKLIITVAVCGGTTREQNPHVPYTPQEIADSAIEASKVGAAMVHLHVRDSTGKPTNEAETYAAVVDRIREKSDIIINCTTGGPTYEERRKVLEIKPEMATLNCGSTNRGDNVFINSNPELEKMAREMLQKGIRPDIMIHSEGFIQNARILTSKGFIKEPALFHFFFGSWRKGTMDATARTLLYLIDRLPPRAIWTVTGHGEDAFPMAVLSIVNGGHARIGFEDTIYLSKGQMATSNAQLVSKLTRMATELDVEIATPKEARAMLGIGK